MMTDTRQRALSAALEFWRNVDPTCYTSSMMSGPDNKQGGKYAPADVVNTAIIFADFLDGIEKKKKAKRAR